MWNYAKLSKAAKIYGGPEQLVEVIFNAGKKTGILRILPFVPLAFAAGMGVQKLIDYFGQKRNASKEELEAAKQELIQGIKDYDATQKQRGISTKT